MNKPQYLAELNQLLIFMTRADREQTVERCGALFDKAGPSGEEALLSRLGSPTRLAIRMSRTYEPGHVVDEQLESLEADPALDEEPAPEAKADAAEPSADIAALIEDDLPAFDLPDLPEVEPAEGTAPAPEPETAGPRFVSLPVEEEPASADTAAPAEEPAPEEGPSGDTPSGGEDADYEELWGKRPQPSPAEDEDAYDEEDYPDEEPAPVVYTVERVIPLWAGVPLFVLALVLLVIPLTCVGVLLIPVFVLPGLGVLLGAWLAVVGGLWCISIIADAAMLFGLALILLALGLVVLWCGLWLDVSMVQGYTTALRGLVHLTLGRKVIDHAQ